MPAFALARDTCSLRRLFMNPAHRQPLGTAQHQLRPDADCTEELAQQFNSQVMHPPLL